MLLDIVSLLLGLFALACGMFLSYATRRAKRWPILRRLTIWALEGAGITALLVGGLKLLSR